MFIEKSPGCCGNSRRGGSVVLRQGACPLGEIDARGETSPRHINKNKVLIIC